VILQSFEASELLARIGVTPVVIASGPLKDQPSPFRPLTEAGRARLNEVIADLYEQFVEKVAAGRNMSADAVRPLADGRIFSGRQALAAGLIDAIGDERTARAWLASAHQIPETLPVRTIAPRDGLQEMFATGLGRVLGEAFKTVVSEWLAVDGIGLLWQP
jgi:protease-4